MIGLKLTKEFVNECKRIGYLKTVALEAVDQIESKDKQIEQLKDENRKLKRAMYKACANWARAERYAELTWYGDELWAKVQDRCLARAAWEES